MWQYALLVLHRANGKECMDHYAFLLLLGLPRGYVIANSGQSRSNAVATSAEAGFFYIMLNRTGQLLPFLRPHHF